MEIRTNAGWTVDENKIYFESVCLKDTILRDKITYQYKINESNDSLFIKVDGGKQEDYCKMTKGLVNPFDPQP